MAVSTRPTHIVQVAFDDGALVASPTWTTIPARSIRVSRGRSDETSRFGPGTATVVVPNKDRLFDPTYSAGTYFGKLLPMRQLRIRATYNAVTYEIFRGHVEGWPQKYNESNRDAYVELVANDALTYLSGIEIPTWNAFVALVGSPTLWYPLDDNNDGEDFDTAREIIIGAHGVYSYDNVNSFIDFGQDPLAPTGYSVNFDGGQAKLSTTSFAGLGSDWTIGLSFARQTRPATKTETLFCAHITDALTGNTAVLLGVTTDGFVQAGFRNTGADDTITGATNVCDGLPHSVLLTVDSSVPHNYEVWVDGVSIGTGSWPYITTFGDDTPTIGTPSPNVTAPFATILTACSDVRIDEVMAWNAVLSDAQCGQIGSGLISWYGQTAAQRVASMLDITSWPSALRSLASDGPELGPANFGGRVWAECQLAEASEQGRLFVDASGNVVLHGRWRDRENSSATTSQATFADDGADHKYLAKGFEYGYEVDRIVNHCTVSGAGGVAYTASDSTSITTYGPHTSNISTALLTVLECRNLAEYIVLRYKDPVLRAKQFSVNAERAPATMWPAVLGLEIGDRITLQRTPQNVGSQISTALLVERIEHDIDQDKWETKLLGSPVDPNTESATTYWVLGTSTFDSQTVLYF